MQILELHLKNFGKFTDHHIEFSNHIQVFYGENEYGKSTIYAFIKAMLFGMERGRGRAAGKDEFSRYEPWGNPNYYAGMMRFRCGGRTFRLERSFDRYTKNTSLICEDDGEELSVEAGDLEMLLGGITSASFENTAAIGQLTAKPGQGLAAELKNYAANYLETGGSDVNLQGALEYLKVRKRDVEQEQKAYKEKRRKNAEKIEVQRQYVEMAEAQLTAELAEAKQELQRQMRSADAKSGSRQKIQDRKKINEKTSGEQSTRKKNMNGVFCIVAGAVMGLMAAGIFGYGKAVDMTSRIPVLAGVCGTVGAGLLLLGILFLIKNRKRYSEELWEGMLEEPTDFSENEEKDEYEIQKLEWEMARIREELKEKQLLKSNLQEQLLELEESGETERRLREKARALELAESRLKAAAKEMAHSFGERLNREASQILQEITDGKYSRLLVDEELNMAVLSEGKRIPAERLSRGTLEQIYFSLRMAALDILYEEEVPVVLDDAFVFYDEKRLKSALKWLSEQSRQVIIFSCQTREKQLVSSMDKWKDEIR